MKNIVRILCVISVCMTDVLAIITRIDHSIPLTRNFQRDIRTPLFSNWETGLREAIYQTLFRDGIAFPHLREYLDLAPIIGRQDIATPFGDVAIIARGQMYSAPGGFQLVQDPYQNDCDGCHNTPTQCDHISCKTWKPEGHERLLALWTVKRIRHRDSNYGYRYELEYKVTSMNIAANEHFITRNGKFDYSIPGHTFIVKADPQLETNYHRTRGISDKVQRSPQSYYRPEKQDYHNFKSHYLPPPPIPPIEEYYDNDPRISGYPDVLYGPPELYTKRPPSKFTTKKPLQSYDSSQNDSFDNLFDVFSSTTTTKMPDLDLFPTTQQSFPIFTPAVSTTLKPTIPTIFNHPPGLMQQNMFHQVPSKQMPILPTPLIATLPDRTTRILKDTPPITDDKLTQPTTVSSTIHHTQKTAPTVYYSEKVTDFKYSEVDPVYTTKYSTHPTQPTFPITVKSTRQFTQTATTEADDYDIFGDITNNQKSSGNSNNNINFPHNMNIHLTPGEQAITIVKPPKLSNQNNKTYTTTESNKETMEPTLQKLTSTVNVEDINEPNTSTITPMYKEELSTINNNYEVTESTNETTLAPKVEIFTQTTTPITTKLFNSTTTINCSIYTTEKPYEYTIKPISTSKASLPTTKHAAYTTMMLTPDHQKVTPPMEDTTYVSTLLTTTEVTKEPTRVYTTEITTPYATDTTAANKTTTKSTRPFFITPLSVLTTTTTKILPTVRPSSPQTTIRKTTKTVSVPTTSSTKNIYEDDYDIFGVSQDIETKSSSTTKKFNSKEIDEIFGETKKDLPKYNSGITAETTTSSSTTPKIIYSNFYSPSTTSTISTPSTAEFTKDEQNVTTEITTAPMLDYSNENITDTTTTSEPITKQSYSTSVSFEINKKDEHISENNITQLTDEDDKNNTYLTKINSKEINNNPLIDCNSTIEHNKESNKILNDLTLSVVNHAKSIDILNSNKELDPQESTTSKNNHTNNNNNNRKKRKYKRKRMYKIQNLNITR